MNQSEKKSGSVFSSFSRVVLLCMVLFAFFGCDPTKEYTYRGVIVSHGYEPPSSGYKSKQDAKYFVYMKEDISGKVIRINVTIPTYYSLKDGDRVAFTLSNSNLYDYGNTTDRSKNLYEQ